MYDILYLTVTLAVFGLCAWFVAAVRLEAPDRDR